MTTAQLGSGWTWSPGFCLHLREERPVCICVLWAAEGEAASLTHIQYTLENLLWASRLGAGAESRVRPIWAF